jgi:RNA polymerase sigma-70 factor (ECF subfamily)
VSVVHEQLFRREAGRIKATLVRVFGVHNLPLAEDVVQDALCRAMEVWGFQGLPDDPAAWLMSTAKRRAIDVLRRERTAKTFAPELGRLLDSEWTLAPAVDSLFEPSALKDDLLRMMFSACHPRLPEEAQVALVLHVLCGFSVAEIAGAFLASPAAIEKRLTRAKHALAKTKTLFDLTPREDLPARLEAVHRALYLLFNEGYHGASPEHAVRAELCHEALRLARLLFEHPLTATPATRALAALFCLHAARLPAKVDAAGKLIGLFDQDRARWDAALAREGERLLELASEGPRISEFHVEAAIAAVHARATSAQDTDWGVIVTLYDTLFRLRPTPVVALQRAIAIGQHAGAERGLSALSAIEDRERLAEYPFYFAAQGELELRTARADLARESFRRALDVARSPAERRYLEERIRACGG